MRTDVVLLPGLHGSTALFETFVALAPPWGSKIALLVLCNPLVESPVVVPASLAASLVQSRLMPAWMIARVMTGGDRVLAAAVRREVSALPRDVLVRRLAEAASARPEDLLAWLVAPVLVITGTTDRLLSPKPLEIVLSGVPFAVRAWVDAPHLAAQVAPASVWAAISEEFQSAA